METPPPQQPPQDPQPPQPPAPNPQPPMAQPNYAPPSGPTIRFDVIGQAFNMVFADLGTWALAALCILVVVGAVASVFYLIIFASLMKGGFILMMIAEVALIFVVSALANVMMANMYRMAIMALQGTKPSVGEMFKFDSNVGNVIVASLLVGIATAIGAALCYLPGLVVGGLLMFTLPLVVDRRMAPMDAINLSLKTLQKDLVMAAIFFLVIGICAEIGGVLCGIGAVLTLPVMPIAIAMLYRDYLGFASSAPEPR